MEREELLRIYRNTETIAVVGASADDAKPANEIPRYLQDQGYRIIPVNPRGGEILGERAYGSLAEVDLPIDVVQVFRPPGEAEDVARAAVSTGAKLLWFQPDTHTQAAVDLAAGAGLTVVVDRCMRATHRKLGLERTSNTGAEPTIP